LTSIVQGVQSTFPDQVVQEVHKTPTDSFRHPAQSGQASQEEAKMKQLRCMQNELHNKMAKLQSQSLDLAKAKEIMDVQSLHSAQMHVQAQHSHSEAARLLREAMAAPRTPIHIQGPPQTQQVPIQPARSETPMVTSSKEDAPNQAGPKPVHRTLPMTQESQNSKDGAGKDGAGRSTKEIINAHLRRPMTKTPSQVQDAAAALEGTS
jgi:hypothetical protein